MSLSTIKNFASLVKFSHTIFAMPFAFIGYFLAVKKFDHHFDFIRLILVVLCMVFARNAAMGFNRYIDRDIDKKNDRTNIREIPSGKITAQSALYFVIANSALFILSSYFINTMVLLLSPVALFVVLFYSYTKRFSSLCHFVLGVGLALAPIGAFLSASAHFSLLPVLYSFVVLFWVAGFDIIYALQDRDFDSKYNLHSIPKLLGVKGAILLSSVLHSLTALLIIWAGIHGGFNSYYWIGAAIFILLLIYQHLLVKPKDLSKINLAFFTTNGIASIVFSIFLILDLYLS